MSLGTTFAALADPNRQRILDLLKKREMPVSEIAGHLEVSLPTLSHHLDVLKRADLVSGRRAGQQIIYSLNLSVVEELAGQIARFLTVRRSRKKS